MAPVLSVPLLVLAGRAVPSVTLLVATMPIVGGALLTSGILGRQARVR